MASGSSTRRLHNHQEPAQTRPLVPARATRQLPQLPEVVEEEAYEEEAYEEEPYEEEIVPRISKALPFLQPKEKITAILHTNQVVVNEYPAHPLVRHKPWLNILFVSMFIGVLFLGILTWSAMSQREDGPRVYNYSGGQSYSIQVGGNQLVNSWQKPQPEPSKVAIPVSTGPYSVLGKPTITAAFINKVLVSYGSPAAGKGQALYDLGVKYGIDPVFALAFFMHESTFGTRGEASKTMSLGNLRCISSRPCVDQALGGGYAQMSSWEDGFEVWYKLIRNLYVADWGATTVDLIIPHYAPSSDNNNEAAYIASVKNEVSTWRAGVVRI